MEKLYKFGFWILLGTSITLLNLLNVFNKHNKVNESKRVDELYESRVESLLKTNNLMNRSIENIEVNELYTEKKELLEFNKPTIIVLTSKQSCLPCEEREIEFIETILNKLSSNDINAIVMTHVKERMTLIRTKKMTKTEIPMFFINDESRFINLSISDKFPQIIFVTNNIITSSFLPNPRDPELSYQYYRSFLTNLESVL